MDRVEIDVTIEAQTDQAVLVSDGDKEVWIALSQIEDVDDLPEIGEEGTISIPYWLAYKEDLI